MGDFEDWKRARDEKVEEEEEEEPRSETAPAPVVEEQEEVAEDEVDHAVGARIGRFEVVARTPNQLKLVAHSRSSTTILNRITLTIGALFPIAVAAVAYADVKFVIPAVLLPGIALAILLLFDFTRAVIPGRSVERSIEVLTPNLTPKENYREAAPPVKGPPQLNVDGQRVEGNIVDVRQRFNLASESLVILLDTNEVINVETTQNSRRTGMLAILLCRALNLQTNIKADYSGGGGCLLPALVTSLDLGIALVGGGYLVTTLGRFSSGTETAISYGLPTLGLVAAMFAVQRGVAFLVRWRSRQVGG
jgi:hypothetical protein